MHALTQTRDHPPSLETTQVNNIHFETKRSCIESEAASQFRVTSVDRTLCHLVILCGRPSRQSHEFELVHDIATTQLDRPHTINTLMDSSMDSGYGPLFIDGILE